MKYVRVISFAALCIAGIGAAAAWPTAKPATPDHTTRTAPDKTLGMALMSATVRFDGTLARGNGVVSVQPFPPGRYHVRFNRPINDCVYTVSPGSADGGGHFYLTFLTVGRVPQTQDEVWIDATDPGGSAKNADVHLIVFCAK